MRFAKWNNLALVAFGLSAFVVCLGCSGKPSGFPSVKPCVITVTDGTNGVADVEIALSPSEPISGVIVGGKTDATGKCVVTTTFAGFAAPGAPSGEFVVSLKKNPDVGMPDLTNEEMENMDRGAIDKYYKERDAKIASAEKIVPPNLTSFQTSPVKVSVPNDAEVTVDLSQYK